MTVKELEAAKAKHEVKHDYAIAIRKLIDEYIKTHASEDAEEAEGEILDLVTGDAE